MSKTQAVKDKITSIEKIKKITSAMQIVALTRLRKMEHETLDAREYFIKIRELLFGISRTTNFNMHPLLAQRPAAKPAVAVVLGSDKGLCGNFNTNIINKVLQLKDEHSDDELKIIAFGKKIIRYVGSRTRFEIVSKNAPIDYETLSQTVDDTSKFIIEKFLGGKINSLLLIYNEFKKHLVGEAKVVKLLPLKFIGGVTKEINYHRNYIYEPEPRDVFDELLKEYIANQIHQAVFESRTAEEMARMLAMKAATDNADKTIKKLTLMYHKARQASITAELMDIVGAAEGVA